MILFVVSNFTFAMPDKMDQSCPLAMKIRQLEEQVNSYETLFSCIIHDLKGKINPAQSFAELAVNESDLSKKQTYIERGSNSLKRVGNYLKALDYLQDILVKNKTALIVNPLLSKEIKNYLKEIYTEKAKKKKIKLTFNANKHDFVFDVPNEGFLISVIGNLVGNALKFTHPNEKVTVSLIKSNISGYGAIKIKDTGIGIPDRVLPHLFEDISGKSRLGTENESSTGLGLLIVKAWIDALGGKIDVVSKDEKGTTFTIHLPLSQIYEYQ